jgi:hypothetical protein
VPFSTRSIFFDGQNEPSFSKPGGSDRARRPHVIHNDAELEAYTDSLFRLTARENPSPAEDEAIELLTLLVERYEQEHYSIPAADRADWVDQREMEVLRLVARKPEAYRHAARSREIPI